MDAPSFWHAPYPFKDFLLFSYSQGSLAPKLDTVRRATAMIDLGLFPLADLGEISSYVVASDLGAKPEEDLALLSGIAQHAGSLYFGQESVPPDGRIIEQLNEGVGIFTSLFADSQRIRLSQDFFGCGILYYFSSPGYFAASNRYHLLLLFLSWVGFRGRLDFSNVFANLFSTSTFFHQNTSHKMDIVGIEQLPFDHEVEVDCHGWRIAPKISIQEVLSGKSDLSRRELMHKGRAEVLENVHAAFESNCFTKIVTDLSGGMDSRAVFAAILNLDQARAKTEVRAKDVPGSKDLQIAAGLANLFDAPFYAESGRPQHPLTVARALNIWRSYFMGTYHRVGATSWSPQGQNSKELRFSGGCGEVYRTFWTKIYERAIAGATSTHNLATRLVEACAHPSTRFMPEVGYVVDRLSAELESFPSEDPIGKLEDHYLFFRNRYHFGMRAVETFYDSPMWFPLMSKSLFAASRSLMPLDRGNALILELTESLNPLLVWIDYDSVETSQNALLSTIPLSDFRFKGCRVTLDSATIEWEKIQRQNKDRLERSRHLMSTEFNNEWRDFQQHMIKEAKIAIADLISIVPDEDRNVVLTLFSEVESALQNSRLVAQLFSKVSSLRDQAAIFH